MIELVREARVAPDGDAPVISERDDGRRFAPDECPALHDEAATGAEGALRRRRRERRSEGNQQSGER